jgi:hypothetical protein
LKCTYTGPKKNGDFYDLGHDLLVMQVEAGCPYTRRGCTGDDYEDGDCIGVGSPDGRITANTEDTIYYNREDQSCWERDVSPVQWQKINTIHSTIRPSFFNQKLPVLTGVTKTEASTDHCNELSKYLNTNTLGVVTVNASGEIKVDPATDYTTVKDYFFSVFGKFQTSELPTRLEQIAYSQWDTDTYTHEEIEILEQGLSLNATSRCNSSFASGIEEEFINGDSFSVTAPYTKTATENSLDGNGDRVRSLETGSSITKNCKSRYGVQDHVGNVSELSKDELTFTIVDSFFSGFSDYKSPCDGGNPSTSCTDPMPSDFSWTIDQESNEATFFNLPLGLPFSNEADVDSENFNYVEIGTTAGITTAQLHDDYVSFTSEYKNPVAAGSKVILSGGSYKTGRGAGTWTMELFKDSDYEDFKDVGFRCVIPLKEENYFEAQFGQGVKNH